MNIFVLDTNPGIAASYHCDQHLHKMILESAQMLSTTARHRGFKAIDSWLYKDAHPNHPCTLWAKESNHNMLWICALAESLNALRISLANTSNHSSMDVIKAVRDYIEDEFPYAHYRHVDEFIFAGNPSINILNLPVVEKYKKYYRRKHNAWLLDKGAGMSYKGRPVPDFMADLIPST